MNPSVSLKNLRGTVVGLECINLKPAHREKQGVNLYKTHLKRKKWGIQQYPSFGWLLLKLCVFVSVELVFEL